MFRSEPLSLWLWCAAERPPGHADPVPQVELHVGREGIGPKRARHRLPALGAGLRGGAFPPAERGGEAEQRDGPALEGAAPADAADGPLALVGLGLHQPPAQRLVVRHVRQRILQREVDPERQVRARGDGLRVLIRYADRGTALLRQELIEAAQRELVSQAGIERGEVEGGRAGGARTQVQRAHAEQGASGPAAVAEGDAGQAGEIDRRAELRLAVC